MLQLFLLIFSCYFIFTAPVDILRANESLRDSEALISKGNRFKLSFFSPPNSTKRYVGVMFNLPVMTVVWVANRNKPLNDSKGTLKISSDGNLVIFNGEKEIIWSTNLSTSASNYSVVLLDTGNLVLQVDYYTTYGWESFKHASDSWLEKMNILTDLSKNEKNILTSWRSPYDPAPGNFTMTIEPSDIPQCFVWNDGNPYWRSGPWNGQKFTGISSKSGNKNAINVVSLSPGTSYMTFIISDSSILVYVGLNSSGSLEVKMWSHEKKLWNLTWSSTSNKCDMYGKCGPFGSCNAKHNPICTCFPGFMPKHKDEWEAGNWTSGCIRKARLLCEMNTSVGKEDEFQKVERVKLPDHYKWIPWFGQDCRDSCLTDCSCLAYANPSGIGCLHWSQDLTDAQILAYGGDDLFIRLAYSELDTQQHKRAIIASTTVLGFVVVALCAYLSSNCRARKHKNRLLNQKTKETDAGRAQEKNMLKHGVEVEELPLFKFQMLSIATENFHPTNKLGQGGFGPVYKGKMLNGQEIAVKRLASSSNQGVEEFMNEVEVISKLQHRNLVRLLGCCTESKEKMLVYEYMPNGSLDAYIFSSHKPEFLDWQTRKIIIQGICRGLLYLHRDSRLKIIHRDLKASNILLDEELNPKISDFGMAKIFGGKNDQANTTRVVGTYGYMAPEYALHGVISEKSDVYSFGVLLLEIVSGKKNSNFYDEDQQLFLIAYAWKLWNEGNITAFMDGAIYDGGIEEDIVRYSNVGLLCVQEMAADRPTISTVLSMLSHEMVELPHPKKPAFLGMQMISTNTSSKNTINDVTISILQGR